MTTRFAISRPKESVSNPLYPAIDKEFYRPSTKEWVPYFQQDCLFSEREQAVEVLDSMILDVLQFNLNLEVIEVYG